MMGKSAFFSEGTAGQMKSAPSFAKDDDSTLPKEPNGSKIRLGPKPIWGMSAHDYVPELSRDSRIGDPIRLCLIWREIGCPPGDNRGKKYRAVNLRTGGHWTLYND